MAKHSSFAESTNTPWFGVTLGLLGIIVGYSAAQFTGVGATAVPNQPNNQVVDNPTPSSAPTEPQVGDFVAVDPDSDWVRGDENATISLIEWSDFECPFCARHHPTTKQILEQYDGTVNLVYRHYPLSFHPNAQISAEASECAGEQGGDDAFWAFADMLFERGVERSQYETYAQEIGLNVAAFTECVDSGKYADEVAKDMQDGSNGGVTGTPGNILVNNETGEAKLISGAQPIAAFEAAIEELL